MLKARKIQKLAVFQGLTAVMAHGETRPKGGQQKKTGFSKKLGCQKLIQTNVKKPLHFRNIVVAKLGLMITPLGRNHKVLGLKEFECKMHRDIPASKFLPDGENSIP